MHTQIDHFIASLQARQLSAATVLKYKAELLRLADYFAQQDVPLLRITSQQLTSYIARYRSATATAHRRLVVLRQFFSFTNHPAASALSEMKAPRITRPTPEYLTREEEQALRKALRTRTDQRHQKRDQALILLMLDTGLRVTEARSLVVGQVDISAKHLTQVCKGGKKRVKFLAAEIRALLAPLVRDKAPGDPVFASDRGKALSDRHARRIRSTVGGACWHPKGRPSAHAAPYACDRAYWSEPATCVWCRKRWTMRAPRQQPSTPTS